MFVNFPILAVTESKQSDKIILSEIIFPNFKNVFLENPDINFFAENNGKVFLEEFDEKTRIDEVQNAPALSSYQQSATDDGRQVGRCFLSGSQFFCFWKEICKVCLGGFIRMNYFHLDVRS